MARAMARAKARAGAGAGARASAKAGARAGADPLSAPQVNPHVVLGMNKLTVGSTFSLFRRLEGALSADVIYRLQMLAKLRLLPAMCVYVYVCCICIYSL